MVDGILDEERVRMVVSRVLESRRRGYLVLLTSFRRRLKIEHLRRTAKIESAVPLGSETQQRIHSRLTSVYGKGISFFFEERPALIGGIRIQVGSDVYDGTIHHELMSLAKTLGIKYGNGFSRSRWM